MIINITQHAATEEQIAQGVIDLDPINRNRINEMSTFNELPKNVGILDGRAASIVGLLRDNLRIPEGTKIMVGGAPFFMPPLERALKESGYLPVYAFSIRESVEELQADGTVRKVSNFRHLGFVEAVEGYPRPVEPGVNIAGS